MRLLQLGISLVLVVPFWTFTATAQDVLDYPIGPRNLPKDIEIKVLHFVEDRFQEAASTYASIAEKVDELKDSLASLSSTVHLFHEDIKSKLEAEGLKLHVLLENLEEQFAIVLEELKYEFSVPLPEDQDLRQKQRAKFISQALLKVENGFVDAAEILGMSGADARTNFQNISPHVERFLMVSGNIADKHPELVGFLIFSGVALIIPESWFLRPLLQVFGFGKLGPVKGSPAAWAQSQLWGAAVNEGSWFSGLQAAGMKGFESGAGKTILGSISYGIGVVLNGIKHLGD